MTKTNGSTVASVFYEIAARLADISVDDVAVPGDAEPLGRRKSLGVADDYLKKLFTLHSRLADETNPLIQEASDIVESILAPVSGRMNEQDEVGALDALMASATDENRQKVARFGELKVIIAANKPVVDLAAQAFWVEVRRRVPATAHVKNIVMTADWHFTAEKDDSGSLDALAALLGGGMGRGGRGRSRALDALLG